MYGHVVVLINVLSRFNVSVIGIYSVIYDLSTNKNNKHWCQIYTAVSNPLAK